MTRIRASHAATSRAEDRDRAREANAESAQRWTDSLRGKPPEPATPPPTPTPVPRPAVKVTINRPAVPEGHLLLDPDETAAVMHMLDSHPEMRTETY